MLNINIYTTYRVYFKSKCTHISQEDSTLDEKYLKVQHIKIPNY